jgi:hypothetical protein
MQAAVLPQSIWRVPDERVPMPQRDAAVAESLDERAPVSIDISPQAARMSDMFALNSSASDVTQLPDIVASAVRRDTETYRQKLRRFGPVTPEIEAQVSVYYNQQVARAQTAFDLARARIEVDPPSAINDPVMKEVYDKIAADLTATIYVSLTDPNKFVNGPGSDDTTARAVRDAIANTTIRLMAGPGPYPATNTYLANGQNRIDVWPQTVQASMGYIGMTTAVSTVIFHELGHAMPQSRSFSNATFTAFAQTLPPGADAYAAWANSAERISVEQHATAMGLGISELANRPFDVGAISTGIAPR